MRMKWTQELDDKLVELLKVCTNREAAEKLGCSYQAVRSRVKLLYVGRRRFRGLTRAAMQDEIERLRSEVERLMREREQIFDDCAKRNAEHEATERKVEKLREALKKIAGGLKWSAKHVARAALAETEKNNG